MVDASAIFWAAFGGGAAAGAVIGIIELVRWFLSRPLLKIEVRLGNIVGTFPKLYFHTGPLETPSQIFLTARNPHNTPVTVSSFGFSLKSGKEKIVIIPQMGYDFPYEVEGGKELTQWTAIEEFTHKWHPEGLKPSDLKCAWFQASSGKVFRGKLDPKVIADLEKVIQATEGID